MSSSNYWFLTCIQISQESDKVVWYSHLFKNFPQFVVIHAVKGFGIVNKAEVDIFLELSWFFNDPIDVGNSISGSSAFSKSSLNICKPSTSKTPGSLLALSVFLLNEGRSWMIFSVRGGISEVCSLRLCMHVLSCFSHVWLFVTLWTIAHLAPPSMGFSRNEDWSGLPFLLLLPHPGIKITSLVSPTLAGSFFTISSSDGKESACSVGQPSSIPGLGRSPREGNGNPLQYSCLKDLDLRQYCLILHLSGAFYGPMQACAYFTTQLFSLLSFPRTVLRKQLGLRKHVNSGWIELGFPE